MACPARSPGHLALLALAASSLLHTGLGDELSSSPQPPASSTTEVPKSGVGRLGSAFKSALGSATNATSKAIGKVGRFAVTRSTDEEICFNVLGCFSLKSPWVSISRPFPKPSSPDEIDTKIYLYTRDAEGRYNVTTFPEIDVTHSSFNSSRPTYFIVHGFSSDGNATWLSDMKDALLEKVDCNVFLIDWGRGASDGTYLQVAANTRVVGAQLARLGHSLISDAGASPQDFHFLGHSLGAQICSYAAKNITNVFRITAMDPAQPGFENLDPMVRLDATDADFVEVIHTNAKRTIPFIGFGMIRPVGHVDFYMNGGVDQPNCEVPKLDSLKSFGDLAKIPVTVIGNLVACSHGRSYLYMTEAIRTDCRMWGHKINLAQRILNIGTVGHLGIITTNGKCETGECVPLGLDTHKYPGRGPFTVGTNPDKPYCVRDYSDDGQSYEELARLESQTNSTQKTTQKEGSNSEKSSTSTSALKRLISPLT